MLSGEFNFPVLRLGRLVHIDGSLTSDESIKLADILTQPRVWEILRGAVRRYLGGVGGFQDHSFKQRSTEKPRILDRRFPIISYPLLNCRVGDYSLRIRLSVTACLYHFKCKIWARVCLVKLGDRVAYGLNQQDVAGFYEFATKHCDSLSLTLMAFYQEALKEMKFDHELLSAQTVAFRTVNSSDESLQCFLANIRQKRFRDMGQAVASKEGLAALDGFLRLTFPEHGNAQEAVRKSLRNPDFQWKGLMFDDYDSVVAIRSEVDSHSFEGIGHYDSKEYHRFMPSMAIQRELSDLVGTNT